MNPIYDVKKNPLVWLDTMLNGVEHMNFFEGRATEYSKASTQGTWGEVFAKIKLEKNWIKIVVRSFRF